MIFKKFVIHPQELTDGEEGLLREFHGSQIYNILIILLQNRMDKRKEDLVNVKWFDHRSCRARIEELRDIIYELDSYAPQDSQ